MNRDFATIDTVGIHIVMEANEWDWSIDGYRAVTMYLYPAEARLLAGMLMRSADDVELVVDGLN